MGPVSKLPVHFCFVPWLCSPTHVPWPRESQSPPIPGEARRDRPGPPATQHNRLGGLGARAWPPHRQTGSSRPGVLRKSSTEAMLTVLSQMDWTDKPGPQEDVRRFTTHMVGLWGRSSGRKPVRSLSKSEWWCLWFSGWLGVGRLRASSPSNFPPCHRGRGHQPSQLVHRGADGGAKCGN